MLVGKGRFSSDGSQLLSASKTLATRDVGSVHLDGAIPHDGDYAMALSADGTRVLWSAPDHAMEFWDSSARQTIAILRGHTAYVYAAILSPDGKRVLSGGADKTLRLWDAESGRLLRTIIFPEGRFRVEFAPDGGSIVGGDAGGNLRRFDIETRKQLWSVKVSSLIVWSAKFAPDGKTLAIGATEKEPLLLDAANGSVLRRYNGHTDSIFQGPSSRRKTFLTGSNDRSTKLWDVATGQLIFTLPVRAQQMNFSPDGRHILLNDSIIDARSGATQARLIASEDDQAEWVIITPEGFFTASQHGAEVLSVVQGLEVYAIHQFYQSLYSSGSRARKACGRPARRRPPGSI